MYHLYNVVYMILIYRYTYMHIIYIYIIDKQSQTHNYYVCVLVYKCLYLMKKP